MIESIKDLLQKEAQAVLNIPITDAYEKAVNLIIEQIHIKKGKLVTSGMGKAGQIAMNIATTFCSTCIRAKRTTEIWASCKKMTCYYSSPTPEKHARLWN